MDNSAVTIITILCGAISALFAALMLAMRQQREDWKELYYEFKKEATEVAKQDSASIHKVAGSVEELLAAVNSLANDISMIPRREGDLRRNTR